MLKLGRTEPPRVCNPVPDHQDLPGGLKPVGRGGALPSRKEVLQGGAGGQDTDRAACRADALSGE